MAKPKMRTSADVVRDIDAIEQERSAAVTRIDALDAAWKCVLLNGPDEAAEKHQAEKARQERTIERCDLRLPPLKDELTDLRNAEAADRKAKRQAEARAAVTAFLDTAEAEYRQPAARIAAFLQEWARVTEIAHAAAVETPHSLIRERRTKGTPARETNETVYFDELGAQTSARYVSSQHYVDEHTGEPYVIDRRGNRVSPPENRSEQRRRTIPGAPGRIETDGDLLDEVRLPRLAIDDKPAWSGRPREPYPAAASRVDLAPRPQLGRPEPGPTKWHRNLEGRSDENQDPRSHQSV